MPSLLFVLVAAFVSHPAYGDDEPTSRRDLVAAIRKKLALDAEEFAEKRRELDGKLSGAMNGRINPFADKVIQTVRGEYVFRSVKVKGDFVAECKASVKARETVHEDAAKDLGKVIGPMGPPVMGAVGMLVVPKGVTLVVHRVRSDGVVMAKYVRSVREVDYFGLVCDSSKMVEGGAVELPGVWYVCGSVESKWPRASVVVLTAAEKVLVGERR